MINPGARSVDCRADVAAPITWMGAAHAADPYPAKRIAIVVPQAPGGAGASKAFASSLLRPAIGAGLTFPATPVLPNKHAGFA